MSRLFVAGLFTALLLQTMPARAADFGAGSLIIPMDLTYQDLGLLQAYGLVHALLRHGVPVHWVINPFKVGSDACADTPQGCWWDCETQGDGVPCPYFTMSPDLTATATVLFDDAGLRPPGTVLAHHGYRGGPFVIEAARAPEALPIIDAWNRPELWEANPWASRPVFSVVTVHEAEEGFTATTGRLLERAPTPGLLVDGAEPGFAAVLRAAGIPQSDGAAFEATPCGPGACGPGTARPDFIPLEALVAHPQPCPDPEPSWLDTLLLDVFGQARLARYSLLASAGFGPGLRETFLCGDGPCQSLDATCLTSPIVFHGHQIQRHLHAWASTGDLFAMGQAVYGIENTPFERALPAGDPTWQSGLAFRRIPWPACPCGLEGFSCVPGGCQVDQAPADCCWPDDPAVRGAGAVPARDGLPGILTREGLGDPLLQLDGDWALIPGPWGRMGTDTAAGSGGPYNEDVFIRSGDDFLLLSQAHYRGHVHYLADLPLAVDTPVSAHPETQGARLFLNALIGARHAWDVPEEPKLYGDIYGAASCVNPSGNFEMVSRIRLSGYFPVVRLEELAITVRFPEGVEPVHCEGATGDRHVQFWHLEGVERLDVNLECLLRFTGRGEFQFPIELAYRWGSSPDGFDTSSNTSSLAVVASADSDGDTVVDCADPAPHDPTCCGDLDGDGRDDCATAEADAGDDAADPSPPPDDGCACAAGSRHRRDGLSLAPGLLPVLAFLLRRRRRR